MNEAQARSFVGERVDTLLSSIVDAAEREATRRRVEACAEEIVAEHVLADLPRARFIARWIWRRRLRLARARCIANGVPGICATLRGGGEDHG